MVRRRGRIAPPSARDDRWGPVPRARSMLAIGVFHVDCGFCLTRLYAAFVIGHRTRYPDGGWLTQLARDLTADREEAGIGSRVWSGTGTAHLSTSAES